MNRRALFRSALLAFAPFETVPPVVLKMSAGVIVVSLSGCGAAGPEELFPEMMADAWLQSCTDGDPKIAGSVAEALEGLMENTVDPMETKG